MAMYALKDKVSEKFSRLFHDPANPSSSVDRRPQPQAKSYANGVKSITSYISNIIPSRGVEKHQHEFKLIPSDPVRYNKRNTKPQKDELLESRVSSKGSNGESKVQTQTIEDKGSQESPPRPLSNLMDDSAFISADLYEFLFSSIPNIVRGCQWVLVYSTLRHGISLRTLIRKSADIPGPCLLIVGDKQGAVFGGLLDCPIRPTAKRKFQGTSQSFVFTTIYGEPRLFRPTGANRYYYLCVDDLLALGGGGNFALCLDGDLLNGTSGPCETFGNVCLAHKPEFELKNVELWGFTHASQYLT